jgi:hypothetical protein
MYGKGENISIGKTRVHMIITEMDMYIREKEKILGGHLMRPPEPFIEFAMDFTEKVIAGGERAYIFNLLDKYDNEKIILDAHKTQDADSVICSLNKEQTWENAFVERDIRTLHEECLNLVWINAVSEIQPMSPSEKLVQFFNRRKKVEDLTKILTRRMMPLRSVGV